MKNKVVQVMNNKVADRVVPKIYYKQGIVEVVDKWTRPNMTSFKKWISDFFEIKGVDKYNVWLSGGFLNKKSTWDIDIILTGEVTDHEELSNIMIEGTKLGFYKYNMLFDIQHWNMIPNFYPETRIVKKLLFYDKIIKNNEVVVDYSYGKQINENLWEVHSRMPNKKQQTRLKNGYVFSQPRLIKEI